MICKDCRVEMAKEIVDGVLIDRCATCEGLWLDGGEFEKIVRGGGEDPTSLIARAKTELREERGKVAAKRVCPRCAAGPLARHVFHGVALDRCGACKGLWFDAGELEKVRRAEEKGGAGILGAIRRALLGR